MTDPYSQPDQNSDLQQDQPPLATVDVAQQQSNSAPTTIPAGWYADVHVANVERWWDGLQWTANTRPQAQAQPVPFVQPQDFYMLGGNPGNPLGVGNGNIGADRSAHYTRQQKGHSLILHICLCFLGIGLITIPYYSISPNHYWHA
ncbi:MAG: DUF2510 domain-containing protein [Propionibacteriaceae bacterium]|jgi:hypothetical protein|nr:DUF2510 domain-containing protein [Propionibacteriaceae bacterium]